MENTTETDIEIIEQYLSGELTFSTQETVEARLKEDENFNKLYQFRLKIAGQWRRAKHLETIQTQIKKINMKRTSVSQRRKFLTYAAAACLVIAMAIPGYKYFDAQTESEIQINESEIKSSLMFHDSKFKLISPINGQLLDDSKLIFEWQTSIEVITTLVIMRADTKEVVNKLTINSADKKYKFNEKLEKGKYAWRIDGFEGEKVFWVR